jgi:hypothetical protein
MKTFKSFFLLNLLNLHRHFLFSEFLDLTLADKVDLRSSAAGNTVPSANQADLKNSSVLIFSQKLYRKRVEIGLKQVFVFLTCPVIKTIVFGNYKQMLGELQGYN